MSVKVIGFVRHFIEDPEFPGCNSDDVIVTFTHNLQDRARLEEYLGEWVDHQDGAFMGAVGSRWMTQEEFDAFYVHNKVAFWDGKSDPRTRRN